MLTYFNLRMPNDLSVYLKNNKTYTLYNARKPELKNAYMHI